MMASQGHNVEVICYEPDKHEIEDCKVSKLINEHQNLHINRISWNMDSIYENSYYYFLSFLSGKNKRKTIEETLSSHLNIFIQNEENYQGRSLKANIANIIISMLYKLKNKYMASVARDTVADINNRGFNPDIIIASYEPLVSLIVGRECQNVWKNAKLVYDFRDVMTNQYFGKHVGAFEDWIYKRLIKEERAVLDECDAVTVVSHGQKRMILERQSDISDSKIHVIYNGFDEAEIIDSSITKQKIDQIMIVFTGTLQKKRGIGFAYLLQAIREMLDAHMIRSSQIKIKYAGHNAEDLRTLAEEIGVTEIMEIYDHIPREKAMEMQQSADFLLNLVWNEEFDQGILGGKFGEYMANRKPILGIVSGNLRGSDLYEEIYNRNIGECFEIAAGEAEKDRLKNFIVQYLGGHRSYSYMPGVVDDFNYENIANEFINLH